MWKLTGTLLVGLGLLAMACTGSPVEPTLPTATATAAPTATPVPTATTAPTATVEPTRTVPDEIVERAAEVTVEDVQAMLEASMAIIESGDLDGLDAATGEALCQVAEGAFEPILSLEDVVESRLTRVAITAFCGLR